MVEVVVASSVLSLVISALVSVVWLSTVSELALSTFTELASEDSTVELVVVEGSTDELVVLVEFMLESRLSSNSLFAVELVVFSAPCT